jgi:hypothetical protein
MTTVVEFDGRGREIREFGRGGQGPGEFQVILDIRVVAADTVLVADFSRRVSVLSPDLRYIRSFTFPGDFAKAALVEQSELVYHDKIRGRLQAVSLTGEATWSAPVPQRDTITNACRPCDVRKLAQSRRGRTLWSTVRNRYELDEVSPSGEILQRLVRKPSWFAPWTQVPQGRATRPLTSVVAAYEDTAGVLWSAILAPPDDWKPGTNDPRTATQMEKNTDTILEAIDPQRGDVLAMRRFKGVVALLGEGRGYTYRDDAEGRTLIDVLSLHLRGRIVR